MDISVIGLGAMGSALAGALVEGGQRTTVWNRSAAKADDLVAKGARRATTVADAVTASSAVVVCVLDYQVVQEILDPVGESLAGRVIVNLTNGTPRQARAMAEWVAERGAEYLDGGIMAIPPMIGQPEAVMLYSGSEAAFRAHRHQLALLGTGTYLGADPGLAPLHDLALLCAMYGMLAGSLHAMALVGTEQVKATEFTAMLVPWINAMTGYLPAMAQQVDSGDYASDVSANLAMQAVGFDNLMEASRSQGIGADLLVPLQTLVQRRVADGHGAEDLAGVIELIRKADAA
jgi:3-hydroxyisobutyrate dehydrogenase-like beta-hydroxyacid dehydrogenase